MDDLHDMLEKVDDQASFLAFVKALAEDRRAKAATEEAHPRGGQPDGWENVTIYE